MPPQHMLKLINEDNGLIIVYLELIQHVNVESLLKSLNNYLSN